MENQSSFPVTYDLAYDPINARFRRGILGYAFPGSAWIRGRSTMVSVSLAIEDPSQLTKAVDPTAGRFSSEGDPRETPAGRSGGCSSSRPAPARPYGSRFTHLPAGLGRPGPARFASDSSQLRHRRRPEADREPRGWPARASAAAPVKTEWGRRPGQRHIFDRRGLRTGRRRAGSRPNATRRSRPPAGVCRKRSTQT